jgi:hypothetical protein
MEEPKQEGLASGREQRPLVAVSPTGHPNRSELQHRIDSNGPYHEPACPMKEGLSGIADGRSFTRFSVLLKTSKVDPRLILGPIIISLPADISRVAKLGRKAGISLFFQCNFSVVDLPYAVYGAAAP